MRELELRYADCLVVIGVHSAKFPEERVTEAVRQAVRRHAIHHPVVNDHAFQVWQAYACRAWPTLMFVDPQGKVIGRHEGEFEAGQLSRAIDAMLAEFERAGWLKRGQIDFGAAGAAAQEAPQHAGPLAFPGKVLADERGRGHLYTADSNHHRVVVTRLPGGDASGAAGDTSGDDPNEHAVHHIAGGTGPGWVDGLPHEARFNWPQGMAVDPRTGVVYIADTENHCIRRMSPDGGRITTIAGTGQQARSRGIGGKALETPLSSPWDVAFLPDPHTGPALDPGSHEDRHDDRGLLFIAMAGTHQIWVLTLGEGSVALARFFGQAGASLAPSNGAPPTNGIPKTAGVSRTAATPPGGSVVVPFAGNGREALVDGERDQACFAQPSGLSLDLVHQRLFVADSETSAVRVIDLQSGEVSTLLGAGLFTFGDVDGASGEARLQHPLAVCYWNEDPHGPSVLIADTYNHRIKRFDLLYRRVETLAGSGAPAGYAGGPALAARFSEPGGLALARRKLFVADTNNHRLRVIDLRRRVVDSVEIDESRRAHA